MNTAVQVDRPASAPSAGNDSLEVVVLHTTTKATLRSLRMAAELAAGLRAHIRLWSLKWFLIHWSRFA